MQLLPNELFEAQVFAQLRNIVHQAVKRVNTLLLQLLNEFQFEAEQIIDFTSRAPVDAKGYSDLVSH